MAAGHGQAAVVGDPDPAAEDLVAGPLDLEGQQLGDCRGGRGGGQVGPADPEALQVGGGQVVGAAVAGVQLPAALVGRPQGPRLGGRSPFTDCCPRS
jgi:hypothetical protein